MRLLAVDSTTSGGSVALLQDDVVIACVAGDPNRPHGERLAGDIAGLLEGQALDTAAIDCFAVAAGPGSFTGLRIGLATVQGLALANERLVVPVSALDALATAAAERIAATHDATRAAAIGVWMDAQRQQVFSARYVARLERRDHFIATVHLTDDPRSEMPAVALTRWSAEPPEWFVGEGALAYRQLIDQVGWPTTIIDPTPILAPVIARLAARVALQGGAVHPGQIRPIYLRRSDAELARERHGGSRRPA